MLAQHFPLHPELYWQWPASWTCWEGIFTVLILGTIKRCWLQSAIGLQQKICSDYCLRQSFGKELDGQMPKILVEFMGIFLLSAVFAQLLYFPRLKAVFCFSLTQNSSQKASASLWMLKISLLKTTREELQAHIASERVVQSLWDNQMLQGYFCQSGSVPPKK